MMISSAPSNLYVWTWLNQRIEPVVAGTITKQGTRYFFNYGRSYLARPDAVPLAPELPLQAGVIAPLHDMAGVLRDASPDSWGRRVIAASIMGQGGDDLSTHGIDEITYLLESGSNRIGALDFQTSSSKYVPRQSPSATLEELMASADKIEAGEKLHPDLDAALRHGSAIGGARPKSLVVDSDRELIAKFSTSSEIGRGLRAEYIAMRLAAACGLDAAKVELRDVAGRDVLLIERFDRKTTAEGIQRLGVLSALTLLQANEADMDDLSYADDLAPAIRTSFSAPRAVSMNSMGAWCSTSYAATATTMRGTTLPFGMDQNFP
jgi:serine/threonine-protein kinase HipA